MKKNKGLFLMSFDFNLLSVASKTKLLHYIFCYDGDIYTSGRIK